MPIRHSQARIPSDRLRSSGARRRRARGPEAARVLRQCRRSRRLQPRRRACSASRSRRSAGRSAASRWSCGRTCCCATGAARRRREAGKRLLEHARGILQQVDRARREVDETKDAPVGHVVVGLPPTVARHLTLPVVREFRQRYPGGSPFDRRGPVRHDPRMAARRSRRRRRRLQPRGVAGRRREAAPRRAAVPDRHQGQGPRRAHGAPWPTCRGSR